MGTATPGKAGEATFAGLDPPATAPITSPLVMRPSRPEPATWAALKLFSAIIFAADGAALAPAIGAAAGFDAGAALATAAAGATAIAGVDVADAVAVLSIFAIT